MAFDLDDEELKATRILNKVEKKIEVGEYVRTILGNITKVVAVKDTVVWTEDFIDVHCRYNEGIIEKKDIIKHSKNIIDLIEVGDYVNGWYVINKPFENRLHTELDDFYEDDIKSIVTKEQFASMEYKVKE